jgi:hypothetical protein
MKTPVLLGCLLLVASVALVFEAGADPILPYQQPIAQQLTNDIAGGAGDANILNKALSTYHRSSKSLQGDISILRDLNDLLATTPNYPALLAEAAAAYLTDFSGRRDELYEQVRPAPRSTTKDSAKKLLGKIDAALSSAELATNTSDRIKHLGTAAGKFPNTSNTVQRALKQPIGLSSMIARVGALKFKSTKGFITGGTNFQSNTGTTIGEFSPSNGVLTVSGIDNGNIVRGIHLHVEGISTNSPVTYPLGVDQNSAFYDATDVSKRREYHFQCDPALTNDVVTNASLTIDFIGTNYLLGRFAFISTNHNPVSAKDTNTAATISKGEFQLNFNR